MDGIDGVDGALALDEGTRGGQNIINRAIINRKNAPSTYKGVTWHKHREKWQAQICYAGKHKTVGYFDDEVEAAKAYDEAARKHHAEFAVLNFPDML